jgi:hypothetical protein
MVIYSDYNGTQLLPNILYSGSAAQPKPIYPTPFTSGLLTEYLGEREYLDTLVLDRTVSISFNINDLQYPNCFITFGVADLGPDSILSVLVITMIPPFELRNSGF